MSLQEVPADAVGISWEQGMEQQRERIFGQARAKRLGAPGVSTLAQLPMLPEMTKPPRVAGIQEALPIHVVRA